MVQSAAAAWDSESRWLGGERPAPTTYIHMRHSEKARLFTLLGCHVKVDFLYVFVSAVKVKDEGVTGPPRSVSPYGQGLLGVTVLV